VLYDLEPIAVPEWVSLLVVPLTLIVLGALGKWTAEFIKFTDYCMGPDLCLAALGIDLAAIITWAASPNNMSYLFVAGALVSGHIVLFMGICNLTRVWQDKPLLLVSNMIGFLALFCSFLFL